MRLWYSPYELQSNAKFNRQSSALVRKGAFLKIQHADESIGYGDLCPFTEMGDPSLDENLKNAASGDFSHLILRSLYFAKLDAEARKIKKSLYSSTKVKNHFISLENI